MSKASFVVPVADLEQGPKSVTWPIPEGWLRVAFEQTEATARGDGELAVELSKSGRDVMVRGHARVDVTMPCVVTLDPLNIELRPEIFLMLRPAPGAAQPGRKDRTRKRAPATGGGGPKDKPAPGRSAAGAREGWDENDPELSSELAANDTFDGEKVILDDFLREFLVLELPMYPRRSDLPSEQTPAIAPPSRATASDEAAVDPRLAPLAAIASRLREQKKE